MVILLDRSLPCTVHRLLKGVDFVARGMYSAELVDKEYDSIVAELATKYHNIDPFLLIKSAMLRRKYPSEDKQHFWLDLYYTEEADSDEKSAKILREIGKIPAYHGHNHFVIDLQRNLNTVLSIASDPELRRVTGDVVPLSS